MEFSKAIKTVCTTKDLTLKVRFHTWSLFAREITFAFWREIRFAIQAEDFLSENKLLFIALTERWITLKTLTLKAVRSCVHN